MKRSDWISNTQEPAPDRFTYLANLILSSMEWKPVSIDFDLDAYLDIYDKLKVNKEYFERSLSEELIRLLNKIAALGDEINIDSVHLCNDFLVLQLWRLNPGIFTLSIVFHPGPIGINCITTFEINATNPKLIEAFKTKAFVQNNHVNRFS